MSCDFFFLNVLCVFEVVVWLYSISLVVEELYVIYGVVSWQVWLFEDDFGVVLFGKDGCGVKFIDFGVCLCDVCGDVFE